ncbi:MAG: AMP-binding protein, partial [Anaerolineae bacterium]|nr:AMP-binding protein [Anaerolineae bacterium]
MAHAAYLLTDRARLTPEREALLEVETNHRFTYAQLNERANKIANALTAMGVQAGDRVSILAQNSIAYVDLFYGLGKIGAVFTPLNWRLAAPELVYIVNDCTPTVLFVGPEYVDIYQQMQAEIQVEHVIALPGASIAGAQSYTDLLAAAAGDEPERPSDLNEDTVYAILYTSGTTGRPKGAMIPHRQVLFNAISTVASWGLDANDVSPVFTPLFHAGGLFAFMTPLLYIGGRITLDRAFEPDQSLRLIRDEGCTVILGVPTLFQMWHNSPEYANADFSHVKFFISGGAPCP